MLSHAKITVQKEGIDLDWNEKLELIIDKVEEQLQQKEEAVQIADIAEIAGCSYAFFQKVFSYMHGFSFSDYIRYRKLTLAGYDMKSSHIKVVEVSYKYGYESPTSFTKAFQKFHGVSPSEARNQDVELKVFPKLQFNKSQSHIWRLEKKLEARLIGKQIELTDSKTIESVPAFWSSCQRDGSFAQLVAYDQGNPKGILGLFREVEGKRYYALMVASDAPLIEGFVEWMLPEETWAIFDCIGPVPKSIQDGWHFLNEEWLQEYPFRHANCPEVEWFSDGNPYDKAYISQIWIPIIEE